MPSELNIKSAAWQTRGCGRRSPKCCGKARFDKRERKKEKLGFSESFSRAG